MTVMQGKVGVKTIPCVISLVILVCILWAYRDTGEEALLNVLVDPSTGDINENKDLNDLLQQDLNDLLQAFEDPKLRRLDETLSNVLYTTSYSSVKENIQNLANVRQPELEHALFDCIRKNNLILQLSAKDASFYTRYVKSLFRRNDVPRRILAPKNTAEAPDSEDLGPSSSPSPSPDLELATSPDSEDLDFSPTTAPTESPASSPPQPLPIPSNQSPPLPTPSNQSPPLPRPSNQPPPPVRVAQVNSNPGDGDSDENVALNKKTIIGACLLTALVTALVALLCFFLCFRKQITKQPISGGERLDDQSLGNESSLQTSSDGKSSLGAVAGAAAAAGASKASVESSDTSGNTNSTPPLGRADTSASGVPPVDALSGGSDPLPPGPPNLVSATPPPAPPGPPPPPAPPGAKSNPRPPAPPGAPPMPPGLKAPKSSQGAPNAPSGEGSGAAGDNGNASKAKLKPFFWDKVAAKPDHAMVWNQIKAGSFQFNEELIETLFGAAPVAMNKNNGKKDPSSQDHAPQIVQLLDPKKSQNLAILLRALNVTTEEVCDALREGSELPVELLQTLLKMAPTSDEEHKIKTYSGEISQLGPAEQFLKHLLVIPCAFKRMDALLFMCSLDEEVAATKESFETLEVGCKDLRGSRIFLKLLEAVLKTGNRMNDGTFHGGAQAFKLDTLLKLADVKGADGKTTLLHFVVQQIIRSEGLKAARVERGSESFASIKSDELLEDVSLDTEEHYLNLGFQAVSQLSSELESVKKAAAIDAENLTGTLANLGHSLLRARDFLNSEMKELEKDGDFHETLKSFVEKAEVDVKSLLEEEKRIMELVKNTGNYFHGNSKKDEGLRLFVVVRDFLIILDKVCKEVRDKPVKAHKKEGSHASSSSESRTAPPSPDPRQKLSSKIAEQRVEDSSSMSDDEN